MNKNTKKPRGSVSGPSRPPAAASHTAKQPPFVFGSTPPAGQPVKVKMEYLPDALPTTYANLFEVFIGPNEVGFTFGEAAHSPDTRSVVRAQVVLPHVVFMQFAAQVAVGTYALEELYGRPVQTFKEGTQEETDQRMRTAIERYTKEAQDLQDARQAAAELQLAASLQAAAEAITADKDAATPIKETETPR